MESERDVVILSSHDNSISFSHNSMSTSISASISINSPGKNLFSVIDPNITTITEMDAILKMWVNKFEENSLIGTMKLLTVVINCFDVDICNNVIIDLNLVSMISKITECFKILAKAGYLISAETIKKSTYIKKTLEFFCAIFHRHSNLFFSGNSEKNYFKFLRDVIVKISQSDFVGPRLLATSFGLKILTGLIQSNNLETELTNVNVLLKEFFTKRWKDTSCAVRETVLLELKYWIQIDPIYFINEFWVYIYQALGDQSTSVQILALKMSENILNTHSDISKVKFLFKKIITVLPNLLLSKYEEVVVSAFNVFTSLPSIEEEDDAQCLSNVESIALELIFSEKSYVAHFAAKHFVSQIVNTQANESEQLKVLLLIVRGIPKKIISIAIPFFVDAVLDLCPVLTNFKLISQVLTLEHFIEDGDKYNLISVLMYVVKWIITGIRPEQKIAIMGDQNDVIELHSNTFKKKEFTTYILMPLLNQLKECEDPTHACSLWILLQFIDFKLIQDKMILPEILKHVFSFYNTWNIPTVFEMISKCINVMTTNLEGYEKNMCMQCIRDIAQMNINILMAGVEKEYQNIPSLMSQKNALVKIWSLAKYNTIPDDLEPLNKLSYYVPNLQFHTHTYLIVSKFALSAYMEILRKQMLKIPTTWKNNDSTEQSSENIVEQKFFIFLDSMFDIISKHDPRLLNICETAYLIIDELLRIRFIVDSTTYVLDSNQNKNLADFIFSVCKTCEDNDDLNTLRLVEVYIQLIQEGLIDINHLMIPLQFVKMKLFERALRPVFNFFCNKETGDQLSQVINTYLVYMFENIVSKKLDSDNYSFKDLLNFATIINCLLSRCVDKVGKRLVSTNIHRNGIQYAMSDTMNGPHSDYPFKKYFLVLAIMCEILIPYDAQRLAYYFIDKPSTQELINSGNEHILEYLYKLQEMNSVEES